MSRYCTTRTDSLCSGQLPHHWEAPTVRTYSSSGLLYELVSPHPGDEAEEKLKKQTLNQVFWLFQAGTLSSIKWEEINPTLVQHPHHPGRKSGSLYPLTLWDGMRNCGSKVACTKIQYKDKVYSWTVRPLELTVRETGAAAIWQDLVADNLLIFISCLFDIICVHLEQKDNHSERELTLNFLSRKRSVLPVSLS